MDLLKVFPGTSPLDNAVVIGRSQGDGFANSHVREDSLGGALELSRVFQRARANNAGFATHEAGNRVLSSDTARVC